MTVLTEDRLKKVQSAAQKLRSTPVSVRNAVLLSASELLEKKKKSLLEANAEDLRQLAHDATSAFRDRLLINEPRIRQMGESLRQVAAQADPLAADSPPRVLANGLVLKRIPAPLGVIFMIFESRPNVAVEAFSLALKSGNNILLRGGKESMRTTAVIYELLTEALLANGLPADCFWGITDPDRQLVLFLLKARRWIDVVVPRGGDSLIEFVVTNSLIPIIKNDRGLCHVYVHADADLGMAGSIVENAKTQRPGVCNAMETVLVHEAVKEAFIPALYDRLAAKGVQWFGCPVTCEVLKGREKVSPASAASWDTEYLDLKMSCRVVSSLDEAIRHIADHGSRHSESIVTKSEATARQFQSQVDAAAVYWNASTRFTDGFEFGLGGELGISTQKLHVRGPVGLRELTAFAGLSTGPDRSVGTNGSLPSVPHLQPCMSV